MALTIYYTAFHPAYFTRSCEKGPGNGRILTNGKSISRIPFRTEKEDYLWRLSTISEKIFWKIFWLNGKHPGSPPWAENHCVEHAPCGVVT